MNKKNYNAKPRMITPLPEAYLRSMEVLTRLGYTFQHDPYNRGYRCAWGLVEGDLLGAITYRVQDQGHPEATKDTVLNAIRWMVEDKERGVKRFKGKSQVKPPARNSKGKSRGVKHG